MGGSGVLINVIVNSIDNSNLPVVCRYCRLIILFTNVETFWYIQVCLQPDSAKIVHILQALPVWFLLTQNCMLKFIPFDFHIWRHRYWKNLAVTNQIPKIQIKDSKKIKYFSSHIYVLTFFSFRYSVYMHNFVTKIWK